MRLLLTILLTGAFPAQCFGDATYDGLRARYLRLRNTDPEVQRVEEWVSLAKDQDAFVARNPKYPQSPEMLYDESIVFEMLYRKSSDAHYFERSTETLQKILSVYSDSRVAPEALMRLGDLNLYLRDAPEVAEAFYERLIESYSSSELTVVARERLTRIRNDEDLTGQKNKFPKEEKSYLVIVDPGHGGEDLGAQGVGGLLEKDVTLAIAQILKMKLEAIPGVSARLTREADTFVPLQKRSQIANDQQADLFISLHVNASPKKNSSGYEVYYLDNTNDSSSQKLAERENASMQYEGAAGDLMFMLSDLITTAKVNESIAFAREFYVNSLHAMKQESLGVRGRGVKKAPFYVLVGTDMPSILVEMLFVDNEQDGKKLANSHFREQFASSIFQGLESYIIKERDDVKVAQK